MNQRIESSGPICFGSARHLFGWLHVPVEHKRRPAIVICNPVGFEYIRAHRSIRLLAERLSGLGYHVLRFDYYSTGDSAGDEFDSRRLGSMLQSVREAVETAKMAAGTDYVTLIGLRLGATLAARIAAEEKLEQLVLWAPCESGALYVREQQIMASAQNKQLVDSTDRQTTLEGVDAGGFFLTRDTQSELSALNLGDRPFHSSPPVLLLNRDDIRVAPKLAEKFRENGSTVDVIESSNFREMMLPPQLSVAPEAATGALCEWLEGHNTSESIESAHTLPMLGNELQLANDVIERPIRFGPENRLFGIVTTGPAIRRREGPVVILLCGGAVHRVSANRMYVTIARRLAAEGTPAVRLDLASLGDSLPHDGYPENKPYTDKLADDVNAAMDAAENITGKKTFLLFGLCSGAFAAMQAARNSERVSDLVLVNQLVYYITADELQQLSSGEIASAHDLDFPRSDSLMYRGILKLLRHISPVWGWPGDRLSHYILGGNLPRDLVDLTGRGIRLAFVQSAQDEAIGALSITSGKRVRHLVKSGLAKLKVFEGTDHTFSPTASQHALAEWLVDYVASLTSTRGP